MKKYLFAILVTFSLSGTATAQVNVGASESPRFDRLSILKPIPPRPPRAVTADPAAPLEAAPAAVAPGGPATGVEAAAGSTQPSPPVAPPAVADRVAPDPGGDIMAGIKLAFQYGGWIAVLGFLLAVVVTRYSRPLAAYFIKWFGTRWGGYAWAVLSAMGATIGGALAIGVGWSLGLLGTGVAAALAAIAIHQGAKDVKTT